MPDASQNGKWEMASGKLRGFADYKCEMQSVDAGCRRLRTQFSEECGVRS